MDDDQPLRVNFGAGNPAPGWMNLDASPWFRVPRAGHRLLATMGIRRSRHFLAASYRYWRHAPGRPLPFADASVDAFYCSHVLEHLPADHIPPLLDEVRRVVAPGGVARVVVPDLQAMAEEAFAGGSAWVPLAREMGFIMPELDRSRVRAALEGLAGFPSLHRTALHPGRVADALGAGWDVTVHPGCGASAIEADALAAVERPERFERALAVEGIRRRA